MKTVKQEMKRLVEKYFHSYIKNDENLNEIFETIVENYIYNSLRDNTTKENERNEIYELCQRRLRGEK